MLDRFFVAFFAATVAAGCGSTSTQPDHGGRTDARADNETRDAAERDAQAMGPLFGSITGPVDASVYQSLGPLSFIWTYEGGVASMRLVGVTLPDPGSPDWEASTDLANVVLFQIVTGDRLGPLSLTCETLPAFPSSVWNALRAGFEGWGAICDGPVDAASTGDFNLQITSVDDIVVGGEADGGTPIDAAGVDWTSDPRELITTHFHGRLRATLVWGYGNETAVKGPFGPAYVDFRF